MAYLIGTDEAGYGPNLGPLTVCGTRFQIDTGENRCLYATLADSVSRKADPKKIQIADSKSVHKSGSIENLETNVLALLLALNSRIPETWQDLLSMIAADHDLKTVADSFKQNKSLPIKSDSQRIQKLADLFSAECAANGVQLQSIRAAVVMPANFNQQVDRLGNKAELLSAQTLNIVKSLAADCDNNIFICCDKHGGRSTYAGMINQYLTNKIVRIDRESLQLSRYHWTEKETEIELSFQAKGESFLPTALSSMVAKYVREVAMEIWNEFWQVHVPGIKPTKGYPVDARRFFAEIEDARRKLDIADDQIWRKR